MSQVIEFDDVSKRFGRLSVLDGLSLGVQGGEVFGFLGRNGAGKSTAIRVLMGITAADRGEMRVFGERVSPGAITVRRRIGYVAQEQNMYPWMSPRALGRFVRGFYPSWDDSRWGELNARFGLPEKRRLGTFSGGMKAKLALAMALATRPELLVLDEPTAGMDPVARREFLDLVRGETEREGVTTFFSTHLIDEIEAVADRIAIVEGGRAIYEGALAPLVARTVGYSIAVEHDVPGSFPGPFAAAYMEMLDDSVRGGRRHLVMFLRDDIALEQASAQAGTPQLSPGWRHESLSLEDVFVALVGNRARAVALTS